MSGKHLLFFLFIISTTSASAQNILTVYDILQQYNFPVGILPRGVTAYELDRETGEFAVDLNGTCTFTIQSYTLKYNSKVTGVISENKVSSLSGVSVKVLFFWINIVEVIRSGDELQFSVGILSADFGVENFVESPQCGCGFDCVNELENGFVSSS